MVFAYVIFVPFRFSNRRCVIEDVSFCGAAYKARFSTRPVANDEGLLCGEKSRALHPAG